MYGMKAAMEQTKLTVRVSRDLLENLKRYARQNDTTITSLIEAYLRRIPVKETLAPIVKRLSGSMSREVSVQDYRAHLKNMVKKLKAVIDLNVVLDILQRREPRPSCRSSSRLTFWVSFAFRNAIESRRLRTFGTAIFLNHYLLLGTV